MNCEIPTIEHIQRVTSFKTEARARAALRTLEWLANGAPHATPEFPDTKLNFNMISYIDDRTCGTVCCIAGTIAIFENNSTSNLEDIESTFGEYKIMSGWVLDDDLSRLFYERMYGVYPCQAYKVLLNYLNTGTTDWSLADS